MSASGGRLPEACAGCHYSKFWVSINGDISTRRIIGETPYSTSCVACSRYCRDQYEPERQDTQWPWGFENLKEAEVKAERVQHEWRLYYAVVRLYAAVRESLTKPAPRKSKGAG